MEIQLYYGEQPITASNVEVRVNATDRDRALAMVHRTRNDVQDVNDPEEFDLARQAAGEIKALLDEIELSRKQVKMPFLVLERTIDETARKVSGPVKNEQNRILGLLGTYVARLEAARKEQQRIEAEARRLAQEEADRRVREAQEAAELAQEQLRKAETEIEITHARVIAQNRENQLLRQQLNRELAADVEELGKDLEPPPGLVPGGRVDHVYDFKLVNVQATCDARCFRLLKWELDIMACRDSVKSQLEGMPEIEPSLPGIEITKRINVSVKASSRIK
jgi:hypothetical protein